MDAAVKQAHVHLSRSRRERWVQEAWTPRVVKRYAPPEKFVKLDSLKWNFLCSLTSLDRNTTQENRWRLFILPQYLANLAKPIKAQRKPIFSNICPGTKEIVLPRFEDFITFLYAFINVVKGCVRYDLWVNVPSFSYRGLVKVIPQYCIAHRYRYCARFLRASLARENECMHVENEINFPKVKLHSEINVLFFF